MEKGFSWSNIAVGQSRIPCSSSAFLNIPRSVRVSHFSLTPALGTKPVVLPAGSCADLARRYHEYV